MRWTRARREAIKGWLNQFGALQGFSFIVITTILVTGAGLLSGVPSAQPELFAHLAQAGVGLLIAFTVALTAVGLGDNSPDEHAQWLAHGCGFALTTLVGVGACLALSPASTHVARFLSLICLAWSVVAFSMIGVAVAISPLMIYRSNASNGDTH